MYTSGRNVGSWREPHSRPCRDTEWPGLADPEKSTPFSKSMSCTVYMPARARARRTGFMSLFALLTAIGTCPGHQTRTRRMTAFFRIIDCDGWVRLHHEYSRDTCMPLNRESA